MADDTRESYDEERQLVGTEPVREDTGKSPEKSLTAAAQALKDHFGMEFSADRDDGRTMMADALEDELGISRDDAKKLVAALEQSGTIRWEGGGDRLGTVPHPAQMTGKTPTTDAQQGYAQGAFPVSTGVWRLRGA